MKGLILLANYYEDMEAIITIDMLRRVDIEIDLVSLEETFVVKTKSLILTQAKYKVDMINIDDYDFLIIPGGPAVTSSLLESSVVKEILDKMLAKKLLVGCICAAPAILGKYGYLDNKNFVCFPGFEEYAKKGHFQKEAQVVVVENIITAKAAGSTFAFAYEIVKYLKSEKEARELLKSIYFELD